MEKTANVNINYERYEEPFELTVSQAPGERLEEEPFNITVITNAIGTHDPAVTYQMTFSFNGNRVGYFFYGGNRYDEGETIPLNYGSTNLTFYPETPNTFTIDFEVENSTGHSKSGSTFVDTLGRPVALVKGEKHNVSCGGLNGCDYQVRIYTCFDIGCSEAYGGATLDQVEIRIFNRSTNRWDTRLFNYNEATGSGVDRYFMLEEEPRESPPRSHPRLWKKSTRPLTSFATRWFQFAREAHPNPSACQPLELRRTARHRSGPAPIARC